MRTLPFVVTGLLACSAVHADYSTGFEAGEGYAGSAGGTLLTNGFGGGGQNGWYQPVNGGLDQKVYTYAGNALGFNPNPSGSEQFIGGTSGGGSSFPRAQHAHDFSTSQTWSVGYDFAALWLGQGASAPNLGSSSLQPGAGAARNYIALNNFMDLNNPAAGWKAEYNVWDVNNTPMVNQSPGADWMNLALNHWYRQTTSFDFATNLITEVTLTDLTTNTTFTANPQGWYLEGGANGNLALPSDVRFFVGGALGNTMGWDNLTIVVPAPGAAALLGLSGLAAARRRRCVGSPGVSAPV